MPACGMKPCHVRVLPFPSFTQYDFIFVFLSSQQDSLLASPIILDLVILTELCQRVSVRPQGDKDFQSFHSVLALLSFLCKAPLVPSGTPVVNAFFRQRAGIENIMRCVSLSFWNVTFLTQKFLSCAVFIWRKKPRATEFMWLKRSSLFVFFRACLGLPPQNHMLLEHKLQRNFLPSHTTYINDDVTTLKKVALTNGKHRSVPQTNGTYAHKDLPWPLWLQLFWISPEP